MQRQTDVDQVAGALYTVLALLARRARLRAAADQGLTLPERSVLTRIHSDGPTVAANLARSEQIRPQGVGLILGSLENRRLIERHADPLDARRLLVTITAAGCTTLAAKKTKQTKHLADALASTFDHIELHQLADAVPLLQRLTDRI